MSSAFLLAGLLVGQLSGAPPVEACSSPQVDAWRSPQDTRVERYADTGGIPVFTRWSWRGKGQAAGCAVSHPPRAIVDGRVAAVTPDGLWVESLAYENHAKMHVVVHYAFAIEVGAARRGETAAHGTLVRRGRSLPLHPPKNVRVSLFVDGAAIQNPAAWWAERRDLRDPSSEETLVVIDQSTQQMLLVTQPADGAADVADKKVTTQIVKVGFGQQSGRKRVRGDNRSPRGMYFVVSRYKGAFSGPYGEYYGGHWIKINYPNTFDAAYGLDHNIIDDATADSISKAWRARKLTTQNTRLGSGIGLHGWVDEWDDEDPWLSWGCVVMHNQDILELYPHIPVGSMVVLL